MGVRARIEQSAPNRPPTMGEGDVDAGILWDWFVKSENFLRHKGTPAANMVKTVAYGMTSVHAIRWLAANGPGLPSMEWDTYKDQMRALFLPTDWEYTARMAVLRLKQGSRPFMDFALDAMGRNNLLAGTASFMNDDFLQDAIEAGMDPELAVECHRENTNTIMNFRPWLDEVKRLDEQRRQRFEEIAKEFARLNIRTTVPGRVPFKMAGVVNTTKPAAPQASSSQTSSFIPIPKLTEEERVLLKENGGCFKCRRFFAGHIGPRCPNPPLDGATYKTLTAQDIPKKMSTAASRGASTGRVAAVLTPGSASFVEEELINFDSRVETVAAVLPNVVSAVVDTGSPDYSDDECAPFLCSNLFWNCHLPSASLTSPVPVKGLVDDGSSVVLIKEDLARRLKLPILQASEPFTCQAAFSANNVSLSLSSFVKIRPESIDGRFSSCTLRAFVSPTLVTDLILGLPFLSSNSLVVNHGSKSCIVRLDNATSYDLLHPNAYVPSKPMPRWKSGHVRASEVRAARRRAQPALQDVLLGPEMARGSRGNNVIAAIKEHIEDLNAIETFEAQLKRMDGEMKRKYADLFTTFPIRLITDSF
ncbi:hypothetical protein BDN71DRAFT_1509674 [Pleurotus eryngii]|uniref:Uncharacterized protein n=1 Tax=Pleurotus eryngii TaxID=5323 RepID=A0A9P6DCX4_PLEER|nr:hypothetical protein BDN71DRAFT_1509674 [Pleurotus eryngii]